jgi:TrmH family RNA methyltransferase
MMLTSVKNPRIQQIRKLQSSSRARREAQLFVVEGIRLVEESLHAGWMPKSVLYTVNLNPRGKGLVDAFTREGVEVVQVAPHVMGKASDTQTPQGILAVLPWQLPARPEVLDFVIVIDGVRNPGNLGSILRTAWAAGVQTVFLPPGNVDPLAPKVVRAAMGAHFKLAMEFLGWDEIQEVIQQQGLTAFLADSSGGSLYNHADFLTGTALVIGGEATGAGEDAQRIITQRVHIPMAGEVESLNAAVAAAILMFEVTRQRTAGLNTEKH